MTKINNFNNWNKVKQKSHKNHERVFFKERDIFFMKIGKNIGYEQNGKGEDFSRPIVILRKFNNEIFLGIPLTTSNKTGPYYFEFSFIKNIKSTAIVSQIRLWDQKRLIKKIGMIGKTDFEQLKKTTSTIIMKQ